MLEGCVFCDLDESQILFRDDLVVAIWDQYPVNKGHLLLVAKRHVADWFDATFDEQQAFLAALNRGRDLINKQHGTTAFNIGVNVGTAAGQTVPHLHMHLIPRFDGDMSDPRGGVRHVIPSRGNYLSVPASGQHLLQSPSQASLLIRGEDDPLLPHFTTALDDATNADFAVAFVMTKGVELLRGHLYDLLERGGRVRIVTGDYLDATDPDALVQLLDLSGDLHLRVFESRSNKAFHPKAYIFHHGNANGMAFVGSSNLTGSALQGGVEWNYRVIRESADCGFADVANAFEDLFAQTRPVDQDWIDDYRRRRRPASSQRVVEVVDEPIVEPPKPHAVQLEALAALEAPRAIQSQNRRLYET
jgi:HKD family nuclease